MCWNWQTRRTQNPLVVTPCGFDPHHRHTKRRPQACPAWGRFLYSRGEGANRATAPQCRNQQSSGLLVSPRETPPAGKGTQKVAGAYAVRGRTGRPRETLTTGKGKVQSCEGLRKQGDPRETPPAVKVTRKAARAHTGRTEQGDPLTGKNPPLNPHINHPRA